jgi:uncharacterized protein (DUF2235 family)
MALAVAAADANGMEQRIFYHRGVGTNRRERIRGGAFGLGLSRNVKEAYRFVVDNFEPGDELFLFGFSRGAFTARSTAGFIRNAGILRRDNIDKIDDAYSLYRSRTAHPRGIEARLFRSTYSVETRIHFIGVWDTVGALGVPLNGFRRFNRRWQFHDTELSTTVDAAFHALAIDEKRRAFAPTIWKQQPTAVDQVLEQVWFAGVHCDVGGGYPDASLADIALMWLAARAQSCGLTFRSDAFPAVVRDDVPDALPVVQPDLMGPLHESRKGFYKAQSPLHRPIGVGDSAHEAVASSAVDRADKDPAYAPPGLVAYRNGDPHVVDVS